ncbi:MAG: hypothetical protein IPM54_16250 [Polyangiaceae bacterium]|nr:hypothetical protein [Polyangiaceae bacterium]
MVARHWAVAAFFLAAAGCADVPKAGPIAPAKVATANVDPWSSRGVERIVNDAKRLERLVKSEGAKQFLQRAPLLPRIAPRKLFVAADKSKYYTEAEALAQSPDVRATLRPYDVDEDKYYNTNFGSPLSYSRPLDILYSRGLELSAGSKVLDFGYGYVGHLRLLATMGIHATGVDVWPLLPVLYSFPGDQGEVQGPKGETGSIRLVDGRFPADAATVSAVGNGYKLIMTKNVLKKGYIHPDRPVENPKMLINLGATDDEVLHAFYDALEPGGFFLIYNICPALTPPDKPFLPWSDGRSPFSKTQIEAAGFEVLEFDNDDTDAVRIMAKALGWDQPEDGEPGMDLANDLSVLYTLMRKPLHLPPN